MPTGPLWRRIVDCALALALALASLPASGTQAEAPWVLFVRSGSSPTYEQVLHSARTIVNRQAAVTVRELEYNALLTQERPAPNLVVAVGLRAALAVRDARLRVPALYTLVPRSTLQTLLAADDPDGAPASGIHLDEPITRQLDLLAAALPDRRRVGVLLGPTSAHQTGLLQAEGRRRGLRLTFENVSEESGLIPALERLLERCDVLLAVADALVYNRYTVQKILLTTYRRNTPVVAFSAALVRAGATLAVYSSAQQVGRQIGEAVATYFASPAHRLEPPSGPRYFSVAVNRQVARSLGIRSLDEQALRKALGAGRGESP